MHSKLINLFYLQSYVILLKPIYCDECDNFIVGENNRNTGQNSLPQNLNDYINVPLNEEIPIPRDFEDQNRYDSRNFNKKPFIVKAIDFKVSKQSNLNRRQMLADEIVEPDENYITNSEDNQLLRQRSLRKDICSMPAVKGPCVARIERWYFNKAKRSCDEFIYGGCQGNGNNFESLLQCNNKCIRPKPKKRGQ